MKNHSHNAQVFKLPNALSWLRHGFISMKKHKLALWFYICVIFFDKLRPRPNGRYFPEYIVKSIFLNDNVYIFIKISLKFVLKGPFNNIPALVQIMAWRRPGDRAQSEPMMDRLQTPICVTQPQWVKSHIQIGDISISKHQLHDIAKVCKLQSTTIRHYVLCNLSESKLWRSRLFALTRSMLNCFNYCKRYIHILNRILDLTRGK